jgi:hypothetical protein
MDEYKRIVISSANVEVRSSGAYNQYYMHISMHIRISTGFITMSSICISVCIFECLLGSLATAKCILELKFKSLQSAEYA